MKAETIVATILLRDSYRRQRLYHLSRLLIAATVLTVFSLIGTWAILTRTDQYRYLMTEPSGRLLPVVPLDQPHQSDDEIIKWTVNAVAQIYTFDFANFRRQFQNAQKLMTPIGWENFHAALRDSGNFVAVTENRYITTAAPSGPAIIVSKGLLSDAYGNVRYSWMIDVPLLVSYRSSKQTTSQDLIVRVNLVRVPSHVNYVGSQIRQIIAR
ncbi:DotI/IcmL/TraM family protein [Bosea sp. RAC05]|uniref:DotI/IcmL/TraM family protein n=1 Tax=Bosea sp. RAC05 TaxID=1842539 RepID=UPI00083D0BB4|nr:DotI/IcmL/TraM family protein [Bosea sp. RAC05]AOG03393.1 macrophage killing with similarity to conjugation family protein [Bosea sp. RAC05]